MYGFRVLGFRFQELGLGAVVGTASLQKLHRDGQCAEGVADHRQQRCSHRAMAPVADEAHSENIETALSRPIP